MSKSTILRWLRSLVLTLNRWLGIEIAKPVLPIPPPTPEDLIGDATPVEIINTWRTETKARGLDPHKVFTELFRHPDWQHDTTRQVAWAQDYARRRAKDIQIPPPFSEPAEVFESSVIQTTLRTPIHKALDELLSKFPNPLPPESRNAILAELERISEGKNAE